MRLAGSVRHLSLASPAGRANGGPSRGFAIRHAHERSPTEPTARHASFRESPPPRPKRSLGQNFLLDDNLARSVVERAGVRRGQHLMEVGPGMGALTRHLVNAGAEVVAVEKDDVYAEELHGLVFGSGGGDVPRLGPGAPIAGGSGGSLRVVHEDVLRWRPLTSQDDDGKRLFWEAFPRPDSDGEGEARAAAATTAGTSGGERRLRARAIGNIPYNITKPLLQLVLPRADLFSDVVLMLQLEAANRLVLSSPGDADYRAFSVFVQYYCERAEVMFTVDRNAFNPRPRVDSAVVRFELRERGIGDFTELTAQQPGRASSASAVSNGVGVGGDDDGGGGGGKGLRGEVGDPAHRASAMTTVQRLRAERKFHRFVSLAFSNRRKMLRNNIGSASTYTPGEVERALEAAGLQATARPQELHARDYVSLYSHIRKARR